MTGLERIAIEVIAGLFLVWGTVMYLEHRGAAACLKAQATVVDEAKAHNTQVETGGKVAGAKAETKYDDTIHAPLAPLPPLPVSLPPKACPSTVPKAGRSPSQSDYRPDVRTQAPASLVPPGWGEFERLDVQDGRDADAEVIYLETLLASQYRVCTGQVQ